MLSPVKALIGADAFWGRDGDRIWSRGRWPLHWIGLVEAPPPPYVAAFRIEFRINEPVTVRAHVSGDERYTLFLDGVKVASGPERGLASHWYYETYDIVLTAGPHRLLAHVEVPGPFAPAAQISVRPGFIFAPDDSAWWDLLGTGKAPWETRILPGCSYAAGAWGEYAGLKEIIDGRQVDWEAVLGDGGGWQPARVCGDGQTARRNGENGLVHSMLPAVLPEMFSEPLRPEKIRAVDHVPAGEAETTAFREIPPGSGEAGPWSRLLRLGEALLLPPESHHRVLVDLENYYCFFVGLKVRGGAGSRVAISCIESLFLEPATIEGYASGTKGHRDRIDGKYMRGAGCVFHLDGGARVYDTKGWLAGRYLQILVTVGEEPLELVRLQLTETRYPLEMEARFSSDAQELDALVPLMVRSLQMCTHETYMDCPYYEQLMYVGDSRLEALVTYAISGDDRMPKKSIDLFAWSQSSNGLTWSRHPCKHQQWIPPFSLLWTAMLHDFAWWRDEPEFVRRHLPGMRLVLDTYLLHLNADGLVAGPQGWNFMDWVPDWPAGMPPGADLGVNASINWLLVLALRQSAQLERQFGESEMAARWENRAQSLSEKIARFFWNEQRGLYAEDLTQARFSEHAQCLALLSGQVAPAQRDRLAQTLFSDPHLDRTTVYFTHYLFETCALLGRSDIFFQRMQLWFDLPKQGFKTTPEAPEPSRSDCHAWGAHPLYHYFATVLGIRPAAPGFGRVVIRPQLGPLKQARGVLPTPHGDITAAFLRDKDGLRAEIILPAKMSGSLVGASGPVPLTAGRQEIVLAQVS